MSRHINFTDEDFNLEYLRVYDPYIKEWVLYKGSTEEMLEVLDKLQRCCWDEYCNGVGSGKAVVDFKIESSIAHTLDEWTSLGF